MARIFHSTSCLFVCRVLLAVVFAVPIVAAAEAHRYERRDIFSDIGNFFDGIEMQVDMDVFQPIQNFFTTVIGDINQYVVMPAEQFFMQANTIVVSGLYDIVMLAGDIGKAIDSAVIDEAMSVENLARQVGKDITQDANTVIANVKGEFDNVITPALVDAGKQIGDAFTSAGTDIVDGLNAAGDYIEAHPELIAEIVVSAALIGLSVFQPELIAADGALIAEIAAEVAGETAVEVAGEIGAEAAVEGAADAIVEGAAEEVVGAADEPITAAIESFLEANPGDEEAYNTVEGILDMISGNVETDAEKVIDKISDTRFQQIEDTVTQINNKFRSILPVQPQPPTFPADLPEGGNLPINIPYPNIAPVQQQLTSAGLIVVSPFRKRNVNGAAGLERREAKSSSTTSKAKTTSTTKVSTSTANANIKVGSVSSSAKATTTSISPAIPSAVIQQWVTHHFLNRTTSSKTYVRVMLKQSLGGMLNSTNMTKADYTAALPNSLKAMNINIPYPPATAAHRAAIAHQIAVGNATAYNAHNVTVKIEMNANAPVDVCLGVPKITCFGNQLGKPYCLHNCATRWYNQMNVNPLHY